MFYNPQQQQPITLPLHHYSPNSTFRTVDIDVGTGTALDFDLDLDDLDLGNINLDFHFAPALSLDAKAQSSRYQGTKEQEESDALLAPATPQSAVSDPSMVPAADLMHPDSWLPTNGQFTPKSAGRTSHHRESSLSSLGSTGPASPFSQNTSNPQIAVTDSLGDAYHPHNLPYYDESSSLHMAKALQPSNHDIFYGNRAGYALDTAAPAAYSALMKRGGDRGLLPPPELSIGSNRSRPVSVASSIADDSPATPLMEQPEDGRRQRRAFNIVPKLDRTMTDVYGDELYSTSFSMASAAPTQATQAPVSPNHDMFSQRLQAINTQHLHAAHSPVSSSPRGMSPFRHGSPLAPSMGHDFAAHGAGPAPMAYASARQIREQSKAEQDARAMREQIARQPDTTAPQTISPKDAILEFHDEGDVNFPLFPQQSQAAFEDTQANKSMGPAVNAYDGMALDNSGYPFMTTQLAVGLQVPQQYPFIAQPRHEVSSGPSSVPSRVSSAGSSSTDSAVGSFSRPPATSADGGTYTCTYHGCTLRFETPALLQKHKREGHRQAHGLNGTRRVEGTVVSPIGAILDTQAGPHRCDRINPSTGKPCATIFSRPYDLTRHEDTIHNGRKQKVRCGLCTEEKTFSRADALTRHYRVCHPEVDLPGKLRRRAIHSS